MYVKSNHHVVHLKLTQVMYVNYFLIKVENNNKCLIYFLKDAACMLQDNDQDNK